MQSHEHYMQRALELATRGSGCTSPNPLVGSIVVRDDVILGEGWHEVYGQAHAEVNTIKNAGESLDGATIYVTLEPCNHQGVTPPCTQAIVAAGIKHVIYALADPNPTAAGGANWLRSQGVTVTQGVLEDQARFLNRFFLKYVSTQRPYLIAKSASSLDGKTATRTGHSQWITGPAARERGHELRQAVDAIVVGADTVIADDPSLTVRLPETRCPTDAVRHPRPVILDSSGRVSLAAKLLDGSLPTKTLILTTKMMDTSHRQAIESKGHEVVVLENNEHGIGISPEAIVDALGQRGMHSVLLEGGASVHGTFRDAGLIDEVWTFIAPAIIGGKNAPAAFSASGSDALSDATKLHDIHIEQVGDDILIRGCVSPVSINEQR
ncbi:MAG: diaminohydroxyphosphoribosylaminopyrimidine deaminase [Porticoccaceae bacterium]|jgi:diaminohydroxyphosphoribosylaminopyrimidine deaminase/5-amino-6-(5-phosphoribosylamino)uracil reductase